MGQSVLANQFVSGLILELKSKVAGTEGNLDQLLTKARFEEAKLHDLAGTGFKQRPTNQMPVSHGHPFPRGGNNSPRPKGSPPVHGKDRPRAVGEPRCYSCGTFGHLARNCHFNHRSGPEESRGRNPMHWQEQGQGIHATYNSAQSGSRVATMVTNQGLPGVEESGDGQLAR